MNLNNSKKQIKTIAFYLPQFYPTPENDKWWEPGFTEWTNVARSKPLFIGHRQPRIPRDLSFYDLRVPEVRVKQTQMAKEAGIHGFCYWHYWFGNGKRLLDRVFDEVVESGSPDFPFCLCWANHSWYSKTWDPNKKDKLLIEQTYPGKQDYIQHFNAMLPAFKDKRYIRKNGKLLFGIFAPYDLPNSSDFIDTWNELAKRQGLGGFDFFAFIQGETKLARLNNNPFDSIVYDPLSDSIPTSNRLIRKIKDVLKKPIIKIKYEDYSQIAISKFNKYNSFIPCINPDFDHSPRSSHRGVIITNSTPEKWGKLCIDVKKILLDKKDDEQYCFIKAWNEWGEGNYLEPDSKYGLGYIKALRKALSENE